MAVSDWSTTAASNVLATTGINFDEGQTPGSVNNSARELMAQLRTYFDISDRQIAGGRLTLSTGVPVTTTDVTAATTLYYTPYIGANIALFDGTSKWALYNFSELSIAVPSTTNTMYDVFIYDNSGTPTLELTAWTNDTTRATALTTQNGVLVKTGATTRRYLGSFRTTGVSGQTEDSLAKRFVWNMYNRRPRAMRVLEATDSWNYSTTTWRQMNGSTSNQLAFVSGLAEDQIEAHASTTVFNSTSTVRPCRIGIGLDSTTAFAAGCLPTTEQIASNSRIMRTSYVGDPVLGYHYMAALEQGGGTDTQTWNGDAGVPLSIQNGITGRVFA